MTPADCPLPEVAEALGPFIKPRSEVARIRQELQSHVAKQIGGGDASVSSVMLADPHDVQTSRPSSALSGVRKAYLKALQAHATAQSRYDALKADLDRLSGSSSGPRDPKATGSSPVSDSYVSLLRQRERQRKLQVIDHAFSRINGAGKDATNGHLDDLTRQRAGDLPTPPTARAPAFHERANVDGRVLQLKKAVLATKRQTGSSNAPAQANVTTRSGPEAEVTGLQSALNELTGWMEQQLAIIGDAESESQPVPSTPIANGHNAPEAVSLEDIGALYEQYLAARQRLIETVNMPPESDLPSDAVAITNGNALKEVDKRTTPADTLLPYIRSLTTAKQEEQSLLQQSAHIRRQISSAEAETARLVARLADESHLVHPGAARGRDWAEAASDASTATERFAMQRVQAGEAAAVVAKKALVDIGDVPTMLENQLV
ncbi:hypothetical protein LTR36_003172 [Oleoguttula mirabilis]|uniref:Uncharacterized protein n=1 Tax=Oleoguttula mirabilis TaxID=1507867 RepID=A0AAV9JWS5_9PEZI|nr:hypothetical protein LTR36_003172 [Oleoguttula mirabilis]